MNLAVFASGKGSNFEAIMQSVKSGFLRVSVPLVVCDTPEAGVLKLAEKEGVETALFNRGDFASRKDFEAAILQRLHSRAIDAIALAGFMRMLSAEFISSYRNRILNIHPALLPSFKGSDAIADAFAYGVRLTGVTVHFVDEEMDHGPIILQRQVAVEPQDTVETLAARIHEVEHELYPHALKLFSEGRLTITGRKVEITL